MSVDLKALVASAASGDKNAYAMIYKSTFKNNYYLALRLTGNKETALEAVKNTYTTAFEIISRNSAPDDTEGWLRRLTAIKCNPSVLTSSLEADAAALGYTVSIEDGMEFLPCEIVRSKKGVDFILGKIEELPDSIRRIVYLRYYSDITADNISKIVSCSEDAVNTVLYSFRESLKSATEEFLGMPVKLYKQADISVLTAVMNYDKKQLEVENEDVKAVFRLAADNSGIDKLQPVKEAQPAQETVQAQYVPAPELVRPVEEVKEPIYVPAPELAESMQELSDMKNEFDAQISIQPESEPPAPVKKPAKKSKAKTVIGIVAAVLVLLVAIGVATGLFVYFDNDKPEPENAPEGVTFVAHLDNAPEGYTVIKSADDLEDIKNNLSGNYILMKDIDLEGIDWEPIGSISMGKEGCFTGVFDGNGYEIKNLKTSGSEYAGLFGTIYNGSVVNLTITDADIIGTTSAGAVAGECWVFESGPVSVISNCHVSSGNIQADRYAGGIAGNVILSGDEDADIGVSLKYCSNSASVSAENAGGIFGNVSLMSEASVIISEAVNSGTVSGDLYCAGVVSLCDISCGSVEIYDSLNIGTVTNRTQWNTQSYCGAIAGVCEAEAENSVLLYDCYYVESENVSGSAKAPKDTVKERLVALTQENINVKETYYTLDFDSVWKWDGKAENISFAEFIVSYPVLSNQFYDTISKETEITVPSEPENESIVAAQEDFDEFLEFFEHVYMSYKDYDSQSESAASTAYEILLPEYYTAYLYEYFFDNADYVSSESSDPLDKLYNGSYYEYCIFPQEDIDWIITNVFGVEPDHGLDDGKRYYHDGNYYVTFYPSGANSYDFSYVSNELGTDGLYDFEIKCDVTLMGESEPSEEIIYSVKAQLREIEGERVWAISSMEFVSSRAVEQSAEDWETAYNSYLKEDYDGRDESELQFMRFDLVYITDDDIPELVISEGDFNAASAKVVTYDGSNVIELGEFGSVGTFSYVERGNKIVENYFKNGNSTTFYYGIDENLNVEQELKTFGNAASDASDDFVPTCEINDVEVTKEEYDEAVAPYDAYEFSETLRTYSYDYDTFDSVLQ